METEKFYDNVYFDRQNAGGDLQGQLNRFKFSPFVKNKEVILDFGCGSGALLRALAKGKQKLIGIEINPVARHFAKESGIEFYHDLSEIVDSCVDVIISNHALEHVETPLFVVREFFRVLKPIGDLIVVVPCDTPSYPWMNSDPDLHLFSWSFGNLGNLLKVAGFNVEEACEIKHLWPPKWLLVHRVLGDKGFHFVCKCWGRISRARGQVRCVAHKPR